MPSAEPGLPLCLLPLHLLRTAEARMKFDLLILPSTGASMPKSRYHAISSKRK